ncbi:MAG TPA: CoA pyrophosphatase [Mycobacteriales bacterium]|nr:CoA pyrophosphatase [Mycobacteriales bacterium]
MADPAVPAWLRGLGTAIAGPGARCPVGGVRPPGGGRDSAVLVLFGEGPAGPDVLLIQRSDGLANHPGQPAFPGGGTDPADRGPVATALREAAEEVGLDATGVDVVAVLSPLHIPVSGYLVTPVVAWWREPAPVRVVDPVEVARVERVSLDELADPSHRWQIRHPSGYVGPAFEVHDMLVWGFTAGLLDRMLDLAGWTLPWDRDRVRDLPAGTVTSVTRVPPAAYRGDPSTGATE